jgi:hypothetical protein
MGGAIDGITAMATGNAAAISLVNTRLITIEWDSGGGGAGAGTVKFFAEGSQVGSTVTGLTLADSGVWGTVTNMLTAGNFSFGRLCASTRLFNRPTEGRAADGDFGDMVMFSVSGTTVRQKLEGYLADKFGIALVSGHPWENGPPTV